MMIKRLSRLLGLWPLLFLLGRLPSVQAQVIPDTRPNASLGTTATPVPQTANAQINQILIGGGEHREALLFHSFEQFNVSDNLPVLFTNPNGVEAIFSRVTGNSLSNINGVLGVLGPADLFLLNPNGVLFGPQAQLNILGNFTASTADSLQVGEVSFSAAEPKPVPSLSIRVVPGLQFGSNGGDRLIQNQANLTLAPGQQLTLDGGRIEQAGQITIPGGTVALRGQTFSLPGVIVTRAPGTSVGELRLISPGSLTIQENEPLTNQAIAAALANNAVTVEAAEDLTVVGPLLGTNGTPLTLSAEGNLSLLTDPSATSTLLPNSPLASLPLSNDAPSQVIGDVTLQSGNDLLIENSLFVVGAQDNPLLSLEAGGDITINGPATNQRTFLQLLGNQGRLSIRANNLNARFGLIFAFSDSRGQGSNIDVETNQSLTFQGSALVTRIDPSQPLSTVPITGRINVRAGSSVNLLENSSISTTPGVPSANLPQPMAQSNSGNINIQTGGDTILERSFVLTSALGNTGDLNVTGRNIILDGALGQSLISTNSEFGSVGDAGDVNLTATETIELIGFVPGPFIVPISQPLTLAEVIDRAFGNTTVAASAFGLGSSGDLTVNANRLILRDGAFLSNSTGLAEATTAAGNLTVNANDILLRGFALLGSTTVGDSDAGPLTIRSDRIRLEDGAAIAVSTAFGSGNAGELDIVTQELTVEGGSGIAANTNGPGNSGALSIQANDITVQGTNANDSFPSSILTDVFPGATGAGGELRLLTDTLQVLDGGQIRASTSGPQDAGNVEVRARQITLGGSSPGGIISSLEAQSTGTGRAGTLNLTGEQLTVRDGAKISTQSLQGSGGDIRLNLGDILLLQRQGQISSTAGITGTGGDGGNLDILTGLILAPAADNSDITANAFEGTGGNVRVRTNALLGIAFRDELTPLSDITASSTFGLNGNVVIDTLTEEITPDETPLPQALIDPSERLVVGCLLDEDANFVVTGRGGVPANPREVLNQGLIWQDPRVAAEQQGEVNERSEGTAARERDIVEAQGWQTNGDGQVELISTAQTPLLASNTSCSALDTTP